MFNCYSDVEKIKIAQRTTIHSNVLNDLITEDVLVNKEIKNIITEMKNGNAVLYNDNFTLDNRLLCHTKIISMVKDFEDDGIGLQDILLEVETFLSLYLFEKA